MNPQDRLETERPRRPVSRLREAEELMAELGARSTAHVKSDLLTHLKGTATILAEWGAREALQLAGLCHAAYGTDGFPATLLPLAERARLKAVVGDEAEDIVYVYCSCERDELFASAGARSGIRFRDRFIAAEALPSDEMLHDFFELTFANELELCRASPSFRSEHETFFREAFPRCARYVSGAAYASFEEIYPPHEKEM